MRRRKPARKATAPVAASDSLTNEPDDSIEPFKPMIEPREGFTGVGRVLRPHGLKGEVRVMVFNPAAPNLQASQTVYVAGQRRRVLRARNDHDAWIIQLSGLTERDQVEELRGHLVEVKDSAVRRDDDDSYFVHELIGLRVVTTAGRELGTISEVIFTGANDVYAVKGNGREHLVPAIAQVVERIDLPAGVMTINPLPGLLDESE